MQLYEFANRIRGMAEAIDRLMTEIEVPIGGNTAIKSAIVKLRLAFGDDIHLSVTPPVIDSYSGNSVTVGKWSIYFGTQAKTAHGTHEGVTLEKAVDTALEAYRLAMNPTVAAADAEEAVNAVSEAFSEPAPL